MRRALTVMLALVLGMGPSLAAIPASALAFALSPGSSSIQDESRLPACCRRNGAHHCAMRMASQAQGAGSTAAGKQDAETSVSAANCCPCMPRALATTVTPAAAPASVPTNLCNLLAERRTAQSSALAAGISERRSWPKRGPPCLQSI